MGAFKAFKEKPKPLGMSDLAFQVMENERKRGKESSLGYHRKRASGKFVGGPTDAELDRRAREMK